ncbi:RNA polymerase sigma-70 factor [Pseudobacter ginsenosidimutans]|uniref:RNA polymerase sigma-70 factor (ECF subfamily) n=1 Tax=Pseudobacter ginsenosidimutans TaxID=661488 RepID=A0A4V2F0R5_9BACT|nr:RNA polymerase sigma-70 factor [Pseudobacter ginsenosidimutans]QEC42110.1 RNA polymerase sigma-70 factor [Pseudobacter ginsenosidimutans]RZS71051.1 RNA polymerase sigma-70 factor (ECF subfamily) [Pseudobacter ginsenosidimutans]
MPEVSDELLLTWQHRIAAGDETAFNQLFRCFYIRLVDFAANILKARPPAEEIVNDVFVKLWQRRQHLPEVQKIKVFLYVAARNGCYNYLRSNSLWSVTVGIDQVSSITNLQDPESDLAFRELQHRLNIIISILPEQCRQVFRMVREDGLKYKEVAEILQISPRTVETQLFRAIKKIRQELERTYASSSTNSNHNQGQMLQALLLLVLFQ